MPVLLEDYDSELNLRPGTTKSDIVAYLYQNPSGDTPRRTSRKPSTFPAGPRQPHSNVSMTTVTSGKRTTGTTTL